MNGERLLDSTIYIIFAGCFAKKHVYRESTTWNEKGRGVSVELRELEG
jgi:hypothetical protein